MQSVVENAAKVEVVAQEVEWGFGSGLAARSGGFGSLAALWQSAAKPRSGFYFGTPYYRGVPNRKTGLVQKITL